MSSDNTTNWGIGARDCDCVAGSIAVFNITGHRVGYGADSRFDGAFVVAIDVYRVL